MNPIPIGPGVDLTASLQFIGLLALIGLFVTYGVFFWMMARRRERTRLHCPVERRSARVVFGLAGDGSRVDVVKCSLFRGRRAITCSKACVGFGPAIQA